MPYFLSVFRAAFNPQAPDNKSRALLLLSLCQALMLTNTVILMAVNGLTGYMLADNKALATLPAMSYVLGSAFSAIPVSHWMARVGRRRGFMHFTVFCFVGSCISAYAVSIQSFWLLCFGTFFIGTYAASGALYRFAAADLAPPSNKANAISLVLIGGIVGGLIGPESSKWSKDWLAVTYAGTYFSLIAFALLSLALQYFLPPLETQQQVVTGEARPLSVIAKQPKFIVAVLAAAMGYGVMNLLMVATPLAMKFCGHPYGSAVQVLEWHVAAMFLPSLFTGALCQRFGVVNIIMSGCALTAASVFIHLSGTTEITFLIGLMVLGVGWNFMYIGGTTLLTQTYQPAEKAKVQGLNDALVFATMALSSSASGVLVNTQGWNTLNYTALPFVCMAFLGALVIWMKRNQPVTA
jgi:predicted MFS family arabinose efflux permease